MLVIREEVAYSDKMVKGEVELNTTLNAEPRLGIRI